MRTWTWAVAAACWAAVAGGAVADGEPVPAARAVDRPAVPIMRVDEVRIGMTGYGLSVFQGTKIERFDVEVLDVLKNYFPQQDLVLIRMAGQKLEHTGIIAGMSGSPVYIEGKLLGAVAYGWSFPKDPIGGVTPIESMLAELDRKSERQVARPEPASATPMPETGRLVPCGTPLMLSGLSERTVERLRGQLEPMGLFPVRAGGGSAAERPEAAATRLEPGSAVGIQLMRGDVDATALGTVTYVDGEKILAFGHPMYGGGEHALPMTTGVVHAVFAGMSRSFKFGSPLRTVGAMVQDRPACIVGRLGETVAMIPVTVVVKNPRNGYAKTFRAEVIQHEELTAQFVQGFASDAVDQAEQGMGDTVVEMTLTFRLAGHEPLTLSTISTPGWFGTLPWGWFRPVGLVLGNPWTKDVHLAGLELEATILHERRSAQILTLEASRTEVRPGDTVEYRVELQPYDRKPEWRTVTFTVPADLPAGSYQVVVANGGQVPLTGPEPEDVASLLRTIRAAAPYRPDQLVAVLTRPEAGLQVRGEVFRDLPASAAASLFPAHGTGGRTRLVADAAVSPVVATPWLIGGSKRATLQVLPPRRP